MKLFENKKGLEISGLYSFVLVVVLVGLLIGIGMVMLTQMNTNAYNALPAAQQTQFAGGQGGFRQAINASSNAIGTISTTWLALIITIAVLSIILTLVIRSFGANRV